MSYNINPDLVTKQQQPQILTLLYPSISIVHDCYMNWNFMIFYPWLYFALQNLFLIKKTLLRYNLHAITLIHIYSSNHSTVLWFFFLTTAHDI